MKLVQRFLQASFTRPSKNNVVWSISENGKSRGDSHYEVSLINTKCQGCGCRDEEQRVWSRITWLQPTPSASWLRDHKLSAPLPPTAFWGCWEGSRGSHAEHSAQSKGIVMKRTLLHSRWEYKWATNLERCLAILEIYPGGTHTLVYKKTCIL